MKPIVITLLAFFSIGYVGCQRKSVEIRHQPELDIANAWTSEDEGRGDVLPRWWESFSDPDLEDLLRLGMEANYDLQAAAARLEAAAAQVRIAGADSLPSISAGWSATGRRQNFIGFPIPGSEDQVLSRTFKSSGISLDVSWEADVWGRIAAGKAAAAADFEAAQADYRAAKLSLAGQIGKAWYATIESREQIRLARRTVSSYRDTAERVRSRYVRGLQSSLDLRLALSSQYSAEALLEQRNRQLDLGIRQLEILLGKYPSAGLEVSPQLPEVPPTPPAGIPSELVARRPDLVAAERRMWAAGARWTQARRALYPSFSIGGSLGTSTSDFLQVFNGTFFVWNLAGNIMQPIYNGGRLRAQVKVEDARSKEAAARWASAVMQAFTEVEATLSAERFLADQEKNIADAATQASLSLELAQDRYDSGLEGFVTVLEAQRRSLNADSELLSVRRQRLDTRIDLHLALGGDLELEPSEVDSPGTQGKEETS